MSARLESGEKPKLHAAAEAPKMRPTSLRSATDVDPPICSLRLLAVNKHSTASEMLLRKRATAGPSTKGGPLKADHACLPAQQPLKSTTSPSRHVRAPESQHIDPAALGGTTPQPKSTLAQRSRSRQQVLAQVREKMSRQPMYQPSRAGGATDLPATYVEDFWKQRQLVQATDSLARSGSHLPTRAGSNATEAQAPASGRADSPDGGAPCAADVSKLTVASVEPPARGPRKHSASPAPRDPINKAGTSNRVPVAISASQRPTTKSAAGETVMVKPGGASATQSARRPVLSSRGRTGAVHPAPVAVVAPQRSTAAGHAGTLRAKAVPNEGHNSKKPDGSVTGPRGGAVAI